MGIGSVIWLYFLFFKLWFIVKNNNYIRAKKIRKTFKILVVLYVCLMLFLDGSKDWFKSCITLTYTGQFILIYLIEQLFWEAKKMCERGVEKSNLGIGKTKT